MRDLEAIRSQFEVELEKQGFSEARKNAERVRFSERLDQERAARVQAIVESEMAAQGSNPLRAAAGTVVAGGAQFADAALLGHLPRVVGALGGSKEKTSIALEAMKKTNPIASTSGTLAGYISPTTPAGVVGNVASKAGSSVVRGIGSKAFSEIALKPFWQRASLRFLENMAGGTASVGATEVLSGKDDNLSQRLANTVNAAPLTAALSAVSAGFTARYLRPVNQELGPLFEKFKRITGKEIPPDIAVDSAELSKGFDAIRRLPGMADEAEAVVKRLISGLSGIVRDAGRRAGAVSDKTDEAADAVTRLAGSRKAPSAITNARTGPESAALAQYGKARLSDSNINQIKSDVSAALADKVASDPRGSAMTNVLKDIQKYGVDDLPTLEALRKRLGELAFTMSPQDLRYASRGRVEANRLYTIVTKAIDNHFPDYAKALHAGEKLRRMEEAMADVKVSDLPTKTVARFWSGDAPLERWEAIQRFGTPEDIGAVKGFLFDSLVRYASLGDKSISSAKLKRALDGQTMLSRNVIDKVMPGVADELVAVAKIYDRGRKGSMAAEGSQTAGRMARYANMAFNTTGTAAVIGSLFTNPYSVVGVALGGAAMRWVVRKNLASMMNGARADAISRLGQGQVAPAIGRSAAAGNAIGGITGGLKTGAASIGAGAAALGQLGQMAAGAMRSQPQEPTE